MPNTVTIICPVCNKEVSKPLNEWNRSQRLGRKMYCSNSCGAIDNNKKKLIKEVEKVCPVCDKIFISSTGRRAATFCSRSCASKGSVTEFRRERAIESGKRNFNNLIGPLEVLKKREAWKYVELEKVLAEREHEFEYPLDGYIFDLALFDTKVLIEFDGKYHNQTKQLETDLCKNSVAEKAGFSIRRILTPNSEVIDPFVIKGL